MSLGFSEERRRRRRRRPLTILKWMLILLSIVGAGWYGYQFGAGLTRAETDRLRGVVDQLSAERTEIDQMRAEIRSAMAVEQAKTAECQERYDRDVPPAELLDVIRLIRQRQAEGMRLERLRQVVAATTVQQVCEKPSPRPPLAVATVAGPSRATWAMPGETRVRLAASIHTLPAAAPARRVVFEPRQPVLIRVVREGAADTEISGVLPLAGSVVFDGFEHRFAFTAGKRGAIAVVVQRCRFP